MTALCAGLCCLRRRTEGLGSLVEGDGVFHFNTAAMRAMLEKHCKEEDILMVDNRNNLQEVPFFLVADRSSSSLVISIRGTLSLADMVTDLRGEPAPMAAACGMEGLKEGWSGHDGICRAARYVFRYGTPPCSFSAFSSFLFLHFLAFFSPPPHTLQVPC